MQSDNPFEICLGALTKKDTPKTKNEFDETTSTVKKIKKNVSKTKKEKIPDNEKSPESAPVKKINVEWKS